MSEESQFGNSPIRPLRLEERELIRSLLSRVPPDETLTTDLSESLVTDMQDGGMGSIRFVYPQPQLMGKTLIEAQYVDSDGVLVSMALNLD
ncbi:MAG: DUF6984 family protein, partial [Candidatus Acidiferrales bacterium]